MSKTIEDLQALPYHSPQGKASPKNIKMLCEVRVGEVIFVVGRWLHPFCSHAVYRVRILENQRITNDTRRIIGELIDFKDSSGQLFRVDVARKGQG